MNIALLLYWAIFCTLIYAAFKDIKRTIIVWMPMQVLFNAMVVLKYSQPALPLTVAVSFVLPLIYIWKLRSGGLRKQLNNEHYFYRNLFILYLVSYGVSMLFTLSITQKDIFATMKYFMRDWVLVYLFFRCLKTKEDLKLFVKTVMVISLMIGSLGIYEAVMHDNPVQDFIYLQTPDAGSSAYYGRMWYVPPFLRGSVDMGMRYGLNRCYSFMGIHHSFGTTSLFFSLILLLAWQRNKIRINHKWLLVAALLALSGVFTCNSKSCQVGAVFFFFALYSMRDLTRVRVWLPIAVCAAVVLIYVPEYLNNILSIFDSNLAEEGGGSTVDVRQVQLNRALDMFEKSPLIGNGIGSINYFKRFGNYSDILGAEGSFLQILPERGLLGAVAYLMWYFCSFTVLKRTVPTKIAFFTLAGLFSIEFVTGVQEMSYYVPMLLAIRKYYEFYEPKHVDIGTIHYKA